MSYQGAVDDIKRRRRVKGALCITITIHYYFGEGILFYTDSFFNDLTNKKIKIKTLCLHG